MIAETKSALQDVVASLIAEISKTASERDKLGGTAKKERDLIRKSGLLRLASPKAYGGEKADWSTILHITREIAKVDSSVAHLFGYHFLCLASVELYGTAEQVSHFTKETAENDNFWGNAFNPLDIHVKAKKTANGWLVQGKKSFCSGATDSDRLLISAQKEDGSGVVIAVIPSIREGVIIGNDWDSFGQRQTDSGSVEFHNVEVKHSEVLEAFQINDDNVFATVRTHIAQSILIHVLLGTAEGAFDVAKEYTKTQTRPWVTSNVDTAAEDPYHVYNYGELFVKLKAADALTKVSNEVLDKTWALKHEVTFEQRGECSIAVATTKVQVVQTALDVTSRIFQVMGARSTSAQYNFDRYWRNVRTHTLHDPIDYKIRDIGQYTLNNIYPEISAYS
ncbi:dibenzothiophene monooxygenase [Psychrobacillus insolitus]|uniref:Dibenzothiophene monooxygenase n=1 Tax=Psychrobacillus insolitus TaxID=1461 RepID=A0A2W7M9P1_9BACI|nr:acyl-CoA dehydrogenase family protein [Psychrobacillus insolitus]PZX01228.1 dibenzothiophene monooxygenase [Psychrobacillus insolitus]